MEEHYLQTGETADESKIKHGTDEIYCDYRWSGKDICDFLNTENKVDFLKQLDIKMYYYPCYYDGIMIPYMEQLWYDPIAEQYSEATYGDPISHPEYLTFANKTKLSEELAKDDFHSYTPLLSINLEGLWFVYAQKENTEYMIYMPTQGDLTDNHYHGITEQYAELLNVRVLSIDQAKTFFSAYQTMVEQASKNVDNNLTGDSNGGGVDKTIDKAPMGISFLWWILGGAVALVGIAVTIVLILAKKKA